MLHSKNLLLQGAVLMAVFGRGDKSGGGSKPGTQVAEKEDDGGSMVLVQDSMPEHIRDMGKETHGNENVGQEDLAIPRLEIVQGLSPTLQPSDPGFIKGAAQGMFNNSASRELYGDVVHVVNVYFAKQWLVWRNRKEAEVKKLPTTGFYGAYPSEAEAKERCEQEGGKAQAIEVIDTAQHLCLLINKESGKLEEIIISMAKTKAKVSRQWNTLIRLAEGARFSRVYELRSVLEEKNGNKYYNYSVRQFGYPSKKLLAQAKAMYEKIASGEKKVVMDVRHMNGAESGPDDDTTAKM